MNMMICKTKICAALMALFVAVLATPVQAQVSDTDPLVQEYLSTANPNTLPNPNYVPVLPAQIRGKTKVSFHIVEDPRYPIISETKSIVYRDLNGSRLTYVRKYKSLKVAYHKHTWDENGHERVEGFTPYAWAATEATAIDRGLFMPATLDAYGEGGWKPNHPDMVADSAHVRVVFVTTGMGVSISLKPAGSVSLKPSSNIMEASVDLGLRGDPGKRIHGQCEVRFGFIEGVFANTDIWGDWEAGPNEELVPGDIHCNGKWTPNSTDWQLDVAALIDTGFIGRGELP